MSTRKRPPKKQSEAPKVEDIAQPRVLERADELRRDLMRAMITEPLLGKITGEPTRPYAVIISLNEQYPKGMEQAQVDTVAILKPLNLKPTPATDHPNYVFATLTGEQILQLAKQYREQIKKTGGRWNNPIYKVWEDTVVQACITKSVVTVKADAAQRAFNALGEGIVWAVIDSGVDRTHPHFLEAKAIGENEATLSRDFVNDPEMPFLDDYGHGSHVAGIIAGTYTPAEGKRKVVAVESLIEGTENAQVSLQELPPSIGGMAPKAKLVSLKVLGPDGAGKTSAVMRAIQHIQVTNQYGRRLRIHGANLSVGYDFNPRWFGCGKSPLCVEVDRLVKSGVVVVVAAGNSGFTALSLNNAGTNELGYRGLSISDPGNAELAITVGSTHRDMPHTYGVSFFSSRGPTGDGRLKPDLVAPGERIVSCAAGTFLKRAQGSQPGQEILYLEQSGTSMAAPHVSGAIAAFLSVRREFIGEPEKVKQLFLDSAMDLKRDRSFQGAGMLDLIKVLQAV